MRRESAGFTMMELVMVIIVVGILAAVAIPRMSTSDYQVQAFHDKTVSALRYAQKTAVSHRRLVCVTFPSVSSLTLNIAKAHGSATCDTPLILPDGASSVQSGDSINAAFGSLPAPIYFQSDGRGTSDAAGATVVSSTLTISGQTIAIVGATGYVQ